MLEYSTTNLLSILILVNIASLATTLALKIPFKNKPRHSKTEDKTASSLNVELCPECNQPTNQHFKTCSLNTANTETETPKEKTNETANVNAPISRGCTICGEKGHYAKKCPKQNGENKK